MKSILNMFYIIELFNFNFEFWITIIFYNQPVLTTYPNSIMVLIKSDQIPIDTTFGITIEPVHLPV